MTIPTVTLKVLPYDYDQLAIAADQKHHSVASLLEILLQLMTHPLEMDTETLFAYVEALPDAYLGQLIHFQLSPDKEKRLQELRALSQQRALSPAETNEREYILALIDQYMLLRSKGLILLKERGYDIDAYLQKRK